MTEPGNPSERDPVSRFLGLQPGDLSIVGPAALCAFSLFAGYSVAKPLRDATAAALGVEAVAALQVATFVTMIGAVAIVGLLVSRLAWKHFVLLAFSIWVAAAALAAFFFGAQGAERSLLVDRVFYVGVSVANLLSLSILWATMSDILSADRAKRGFPIVGLGITLGGISGSFIVKLLAVTLSYSSFMWVATALLVISAGCAAWILRYSPEHASRVRRASGGTIAEMTEGMWRAIASPYLRRLVLYLFLYSATGTLVYMLQVKILSVQFADLPKADAKIARTNVTASIDLYANILTAALQFLVAGRVLRWLGIAATLTITPLTTLASIGLLLFSPTVTMLIPVQVARRGLHYALDRPAREVLYTVVSPVERYKSKSFIDTFVYRFGDVVGGWTQVGLEKISPPLGISSVLILCTLFAGVGVSLGRTLKQRERASETPTV
ncbi:MAG: hypothetical protein KF691_12800 [Phycisphaeraceae bacterium]|nr:hypothetical protein [Phycisphaeraceae bacterium]